MIKKTFLLFVLIFTFQMHNSNAQSGQLILVEVGKQIGFSGEVGTTKEMANLAYFPGFNLVRIAEKVDKFLREEYFPKLGIKVSSKEKLLKNYDFQSFKSPYFKDKDSGTDAAGIHRSNALTGAYSWGGGYVPFTYKTVLTDHYDDFPAMKGMFPDESYFITAELGFSYILDSDPSISPLLILEFRRTKDQAHKKLVFTTFMEIEESKRDDLLLSPPDTKRTVEELERSTGPLFDRMMESIEHDHHKIEKLINHY